MAIQTMLLDPNAASYTDDEIVGKVNTATANIKRADACESTAVDLSGKDSDDIGEGATNKYMVDDDGVVLAINSATDPITREAALSQDDLKIVKTNPAGGEFLVKAIHRDTDGKLQVEYDDTAQ